MAKNISLLGADYPDVPAVQLPQTGGGTATFYELSGYYSETEQDTGRIWDNKPVYSRMVRVTKAANAETGAVDLTGAGIDVMVDMSQGCVWFAAGNQYLPLSFAASSTNWMRYFYSKSTKEITIQCGTTLKEYEMTAKIMIFYTKA